MNKIQSRLTSFHLTALWAGLTPLPLISPLLSLPLFLLSVSSSFCLSFLEWWLNYHSSHSGFKREQNGAGFCEKKDRKKKRLLIFYSPSLTVRVHWALYWIIPVILKDFRAGAELWINSVSTVLNDGGGS